MPVLTWSVMMDIGCFSLLQSFLLIDLWELIKTVAHGGILIPRPQSMTSDQILTCKKHGSGS